MGSKNKDVRKEKKMKARGEQRRLKEDRTPSENPEQRLKKFQRE